MAHFHCSESLAQKVPAAGVRRLGAAKGAIQETANFHIGRMGRDVSENNIDNASVKILHRQARADCPSCEAPLAVHSTAMTRFSRRRFLQVGGTAAAAAIAPAAAASESKSGFPPSIANLKSMKGQAAPITVEERKARVERAQELMAQDNLQAIAITSGSSLTYYSAVRWWTSERLFAMVLPAKGKAFFVCPAFEE